MLVVWEQFGEIDYRPGFGTRLEYLPADFLAALSGIGSHEIDDFLGWERKIEATLFLVVEWSDVVPGTFEIGESRGKFEERMAQTVSARFPFSHPRDSVYSVVQPLEPEPRPGSVPSNRGERREGGDSNNSHGVPFWLKLRVLLFWCAVLRRL